MCLLAVISFILAWKIPFFWLVFLWSLWALAQQGGRPRSRPSVGSSSYPRARSSSPTLYELLEVSPQASPEVIKAAYRQLALKYHPDRQSTERDKLHASEKMKLINRAYDILSDPVRRAEYDRAIRGGGEL